MRFSTLLFTGAAFVGTVTAVAAFDNKVYLIRHGEKPADGGQGLNPQGKERADCLKRVFGPSSPFNLGYILAEKPQKNGDRARPLMTATPLAQELGLTVDTSCDRDDSGCVADAVNAFAKRSTSNILICWEHGRLTDIMDALDVKNAPHYPSNSFNLIFTVKDQTLISQTSENCTGLDDRA